MAAEPADPSEIFRYIAVQCNACDKLGQEPEAQSITELRRMLVTRGWLIHPDLNIDYCEQCVKDYKLSLK